MVHTVAVSSPPKCSNLHHSPPYSSSLLSTYHYMVTSVLQSEVQGLVVLGHSPFFDFVLDMLPVRDHLVLLLIHITNHDTFCYIQIVAKGEVQFFVRTETWAIVGRPKPTNSFINSGTMGFILDFGSVWSVHAKKCIISFFIFVFPRD